MYNNPEPIAGQENAITYTASSFYAGMIMPHILRRSLLILAIPAGADTVRKVLGFIVLELTIF
jgi:hypothetical protein